MAVFLVVQVAALSGAFAYCSRKKKRGISDAKDRLEKDDN